MRVLFLYPNHRGMNMLPPAIGLLSSCLKREGHIVDLFDTTHYDAVKIDGEVDTKDSDASKGDRLMARPFKMPKEVTLKKSDVYEDFVEKVESFGPDLIAFSTTEDMYHLGVRLLNCIKHLNILTIAGGVFPTFAPELVLNQDGIDIVCKGEGEDALVELCRRLEKSQSYDDINNLWVNTKNGIKSNPTKMIDMDSNPLIDMSLFEEARFYRPMGGEVYRMFPVETHRGCPYKCAYCNSPSQMLMYKEEANSNYLRRKSFENMRRELEFYKYEMKAEYLYFWADTFFSWGRSELEAFAEMYKDINLPFWMQTRPETINKKRMDLIKEMGCARISFGVEHGNEAFRAKFLQRKMKNELITARMNTINEYDIPYSVNNVIGFPYETREIAMDTVRLNKTFKANDRNAYSFTPFAGTPLRKVAEELGFIKKEDIVRSVIVNGSIIDMPQFPQKDVLGLVKTFNMYVNFPEDRWPEIRRAEQDDNLYEKLKIEYIDKFWNEEISFEQSSQEVIPLISN